MAFGSISGVGEALRRLAGCRYTMMPMNVCTGNAHSVPFAASASDQNNDQIARSTGPYHFSRELQKGEQVLRDMACLGVQNVGGGVKTRSRCPTPRRVAYRSASEVS